MAGAVPIRGSFKRWALTAAAVVLLFVLGATVRLWVPWLLRFAVARKDTVDAVKSLLETIALLVGWASAAAVFYFKLWKRPLNNHESTQRPPGAVQNENAGRDIIHSLGNVQTGGVGVASQRDVNVAGDIVGEKIIIQQPAIPALQSLHQLRPPPLDFKGRESELSELRSALIVSQNADGEPGRAIVCGLQGQGGVGKTTLALKLAEELAHRFQDAQIYLDLKGASAEPVLVSEALAYVIRSFHPDSKLPQSQTELETLYRSVLHGKRSLLLMDNAHDAAQVAPLLPPVGCALIVTSRRHFTLPGLLVMDLETLAPADAASLLLAIAPRINGHAEVIAQLCDFLPQALRLAAGALKNRKDLSPQEYVRQLGDEKKRLRLLQDADQSVDASIGLSYSLLGHAMQEHWRTLGVFPDTFDAPAAAAVLGMADENGIDSSHETLSRLVQSSMLEWNETSKRYRLHDLMRDFARARLDVTVAQLAAKRHAAHYLHVLSNANALYERGGEALAQALALFDVEWGNIQAGQSWAATNAAASEDAARLCSGYPTRGAYLLSLRQHPLEHLRWVKAALAAAGTLNDRAAQNIHLGNAGVAYQELGEYKRAIECHEVLVAIARETGDRWEEGAALGNLGLAYYSLGEYRRAIEFQEQYLVIAREFGDRRGEGNALGSLGAAYHSLGDFRRTIEYQEQCLAITREIGDRRGEGNALGNLGAAYGALIDHRRAIEYQEQCLAIAREIGDRRGEAGALGNLGIAYHSHQDYGRAIEYHEQQLAIARQIGDPKREGVALGNLGMAHFGLEDYRRAIEYLEQLLVISRTIGDRYGEASALWNISLVLSDLDEYEKAIQHARGALEIYVQIESPYADRVRQQLEAWQSERDAADP